MAAIAVAPRVFTVPEAVTRRLPRDSARMASDQVAVTDPASTVRLAPVPTTPTSIPRRTPVTLAADTRTLPVAPKTLIPAWAVPVPRPTTAPVATIRTSELFGLLTSMPLCPPVTDAAEIVTLPSARL